MAWRIETQKPLIRGSLADGTAPVMHWVPAPYFGQHHRRLDAMRAYVQEMDPGYRGAPARIIRGQWRAWARSSGLRTVRAG